MPISSSTTRMCHLPLSLLFGLPRDSGRRMETCAPPCGRLVMSMLPWCSSTIFLTIAKAESGALGLGRHIGFGRRGR